MRRMMLILVALSFIGPLAGCRTSHGVCDCEHDDHCSTRAPWLGHGSVAPAGEMIVAPATALRDGKKL